MLTNNFITPFLFLFYPDLILFLGVSCLQSIFHKFGDEFREDVLCDLLEGDPEHGCDKKLIMAEALGYTAEAQHIDRSEKLD